MRATSGANEEFLIDRKSGRAFRTASQVIPSNQSITTHHLIKQQSEKLTGNWDLLLFPPLTMQISCFLLGTTITQQLQLQAMVVSWLTDWLGPWLLAQSLSVKEKGVSTFSKAMMMPNKLMTDWGLMNLGWFLFCSLVSQGSHPVVDASTGLDGQTSFPGGVLLVW